MTEVLTAQEKTREGPGIPSEAMHWYTRKGQPMYEVQGKNGKMRPTTLADARKLDLVPGYSTIAKQVWNFWLLRYMKKEVAMSALTIPRIDDENDEAFIDRIIEEGGEHARLAAERGTSLHKAIADYHVTGRCAPEWIEHIKAVNAAMEQYGIDVAAGRAEVSFASQLGYGGKVDLHSDTIGVWDFKTKEKIDDEKQLVYDNHIMQCAAYGFGLFGKPSDIFGHTPSLKIEKPFPAGNVFIGVEDEQVRIFEHEWNDLRNGFYMFKNLLEYWERSKKFGPY